ncbi:MAG: hypothetical protein WBK76_01595 [Candidatus Saccharimonadales bacterium]
MQAPSQDNQTATAVAQELNRALQRIFLVCDEKWSASSGIGHGAFMATRRNKLEAIAADMTGVMMELFDMSAHTMNREQQDERERLLAIALRWMAFCSVPAATPWFRAYRWGTHRPMARARAYVAYFRGRVSFFADDGVIPPKD